MFSVTTADTDGETRSPFKQQPYGCFWPKADVG
jgi:hypothetical protein